MAENDSSSMFWFITGAVIGAAAALLYAPGPGKQTRDQLTRKGAETADSLTQTSNELMDKGKELYERGRGLAEEAAELFERGRKLVRG
jgi:gas vesicle protein